MTHLDTFFASTYVSVMEPSEIRALRKARKQSQEAFGRELGVDRRTIHRWEAGETEPPGNLLDLACKQLESENAARRA